MRILFIFCLSGCGYGVRGEVGPSYTSGKGFGVTAQASTSVAGFSLFGMYGGLLAGAWAGTAPGELSGGLLIGGQYGLAPGFGGEPSDPDERSGMAGTLSATPRFGVGGFSAGASLSVGYGWGEAVERHAVVLNQSSKGNWVEYYYDREYRVLGLTLQSQLSDLYAEEPGQRFDVMLYGEWLRL